MTRPLPGSLDYGEKGDAMLFPFEDKDPEIMPSSGAPLLRKTRKAPQRSSSQSSRFLSLLSLILHLTLVAIHLAFLGIWATKLEHKAILSLEHQAIASFVVTAISTTCGVLFSALLIFVTQTLAIQRELQMNQPLTTTHDTVGAWSGMGSAAFYLRQQRVVPASTLGVLSVFSYLSGSLIIHVSTPALFAVETFNASNPVSIGTYGLPAYNWSGYDLTNETDVGSALRTFCVSLHLGLSGGTLYDVLELNEGIGNVTVNATGFNISCGYSLNVKTSFVPANRSSDDTWQVTLPEESRVYPVHPTFLITADPGLVISQGTNCPRNYAFMYSTIPIIDSNNNTGPWADLTPPMRTTVSSIQVLQCSQTLVAQKAIVDPQSRKMLAVDPPIKKIVSAISPFKSSAFDTSGNLLLNAICLGATFWSKFYADLPKSAFPFDLKAVPSSLPLGAPRSYMFMQDLYLIERLLGHIPPTHGLLAHASGTPLAVGLQGVENPPYLLRGNVMVHEFFTQARLDIVAGLTASTALMLISLQYSIFPWREKDGGHIAIRGTGILHTIWLYRSHPELEALLPQVDDPTDDNLRAVGMVATRLAVRGSSESL
ncbi:hypothetical protein B0H19DRAFT_1082946 [Mycena capillaripes]|nr:hypothetical protein B0H19DRAFT_1082946 [Mycena capillaripes]